MKTRIDPKTIAKAMKAAAVVAKTGTREERSGKFIAPKNSRHRGRESEGVSKIISSCNH